jgi:hypothetical protein
VAQTEEEEEPSLFLVSAVSQIFPKSPALEQSGHGTAVDHDSSKAQAEEQLGLRVSDAPDQHRVELMEERVFTQIGNNGEHQDHRWWVLDTGATNHMTGARAAFSKLDFRIRGSVKFGNGSIIEIERRGTIIFHDKGGEH